MKSICSRRGRRSPQRKSGNQRPSRLSKQTVLAAAQNVAIVKTGKMTDSLDNERLEPATTCKTKEPEIVWTHDDFARELKKAQRAGPSKMSNDHLMDFCVGVRAYYGGRFLVDACPFFKELWRRICRGELHMTKTEACRQIGCTRQWANAIVSGRADERRKARSKAKGAKGGNPVSDIDASTVLSKDEYVREISKNVFAKLAPLLKNHWDLYRDICEELGKQLIEAGKTPPVAKALAAGAD